MPQDCMSGILLTSMTFTSSSAQLMPEEYSRSRSRSRSKSRNRSRSRSLAATSMVVIACLATRWQDLSQQPILVVSEVPEMFRIQIKLIDSDFQYLENGVSKIFIISLTRHWDIWKKDDVLRVFEFRTSLWFYYTVFWNCWIKFVSLITARWKQIY